MSFCESFGVAPCGLIVPLSRTEKSQKIEILIRVMVYNIDRLIGITEDYVLLIVKIIRDS